MCSMVLSVPENQECMNWELNPLIIDAEFGPCCAPTIQVLDSVRVLHPPFRCCMHNASTIELLGTISKKIGSAVIMCD